MAVEFQRDSDGSRLVWAAVTLLGLVGLAYAGWLGVSMMALDDRIAKLEATQTVIMRELHDIERQYQ